MSCANAGVVNIAIEGQLLRLHRRDRRQHDQQPYLGLLAAAVAGAVVSMVLAVFSIKYVVNQIIVGVVLNVLVSGLTGFLFSTVMQANKEMFNSPAGCPSSKSRSCPASRSSAPSCSSSPWWAT